VLGGLVNSAQLGRIEAALAPLTYAIPPATALRQPAH
jgi:hypothetical protein